jgi:flagellar FliJ protein
LKSRRKRRPMRRFQFRLERFLDLKRYKEREQELALARVQGECLLLKRRISGIEEEIDGSRGRSFASGKAVDVESMTRREFYIRRLLRDREKAGILLAEKTVELAKVRARYLQAAKERKVLDKLKERKASEYYERQKDEEFKTIDDMNTASALRQRW